MAVIPSLALTPSAYKANKVYSILPSNGDGDFDFTRASSATRVNENGLIETVGSNVPRLNYPLIDGVVSGCPSLLLEPQRTNNILYSEDFSQSVYASPRASLDNNVHLSPSGLLTAAKLIEDTTSNASHYMYYNPLIGAETRTVSVFLKNAGRRYATLLLTNTTDGTRGQTWFDLEEGVVVSGLGKIQDYGNGWYRCSISGTSTTNDRFDIRMSIDGISQNYTGNGVDGIYVYGFQAEQGSYPTSYIPTNGSIATRIVETCNNAGNDQVINSTEGVLYLDFKKEHNGLETWSINDGTSSNRVYMGFNGSNFISQVRSNGGASQASFTTALNNNTRYKCALAYKLNDFVLYINGVQVGTDNSGVVPLNMSKLSANASTSSDAPFFSPTNGVELYNTRLSNAELQALTTI